LVRPRQLNLPDDVVGRAHIGVAPLDVQIVLCGGLVIASAVLRHDGAGIRG
jgi:hypothetical protein